MPRKIAEKPIPPMGPGSKVVALTPQLRRHITQRMVGRKKNIKAFDMSFNTVLIKKLPEEIFKNEELVDHARSFEAPNNRLKKLPKDVGVWTELEHFDVHHNQLKRFNWYYFLHLYRVGQKVSYCTFFMSSLNTDQFSQFFH